MQNRAETPADDAGLPWTLTAIPFEQIERERVRADENLFFVLAGASFIESGSAIYTRNLVAHFGTSPVADWLSRHWEPEELQHGRALRAYVERVWPEFDWPGAYQGFIAEYAGYCLVEELEPSPALELAARCVVETGTATLYRALQDYTDEPVLKRLAAHIRSDEVRHYKNFHYYFNRYNLEEGHGRWRIFEALVRRILEIRSEDADCALRHVFLSRYPHLDSGASELRRISVLARDLVMRNASADMMVKMFLKPLALPSCVQPYVQVPIARVMQHFLSH